MFGTIGNPDHNESVRIIHAALDHDRGRELAAPLADPTTSASISYTGPAPAPTSRTRCPRCRT
jgi:hypothetical protein